MIGGPTTDRRGRAELRELQQRLDTWVEGAPPVLGELLPALPGLLDCDNVVTFGVSPRGSGLAVDFVHGAGLNLPAFAGALDSFLVDKRVGWTGWNPACAQTRDRNRAVGVLATLGKEKLEQLPIYQQVLTKLKLDNQDQARLLVCDGPKVLAWIGCFVPAASAWQLDGLQALAPALRRRLTLERRLEDQSLRMALIGPALDRVASAAFVISRQGSVAHANAIGKAVLQTNASLSEDLRAMAMGRLPPPPGTLMTRVKSVGLPDHYLMIMQDPPRGLAASQAACRQQWRLTSRQSETLALVVRGLGNRDIATHLRCSESTVEFHVSAILRRSGCSSRSVLASEIWART